LIGTIGWQGVLAAGGVLPIALVPFLLRYPPESIRFLLLLDSRHAHETSERHRGGDRRGRPRRADAAPGCKGQAVPGQDAVRAAACGRHAVDLGDVLHESDDHLFADELDPRAAVERRRLNPGCGTDIDDTSDRRRSRQRLARRQMDRADPQRVLAWAYLAALPIIILCAFSDHDKALIVLAIFVLSFLVTGGQIGGYALVANFYPTSSRSTGVSWANAVGRIGAALGSMAGGFMMTAGIQLREIILTLLVPAAIATSALFLLGHVRATRKSQAVDAVPMPTEPAP
jgi:AAHS family 4-hydroxybenzoate transporter-like MFS transporter